jgi:hypothetical protein
MDRLPREHGAREFLFKNIAARVSHSLALSLSGVLVALFIIEEHLSLQTKCGAAAAAASRVLILVDFQPNKFINGPRNRFCVLMRNEELFMFSPRQTCVLSIWRGVNSIFSGGK